MDKMQRLHRGAGRKNRPLLPAAAKQPCGGRGKNRRFCGGQKFHHRRQDQRGASDLRGGVNFGCGVVTVNYDGKQKARCKIGDNAFIGCNTNLIAPVSVGEGAYTAAGTTITEDVPEGGLAIGRARQTVKENWATEHIGFKRK